MAWILWGQAVASLAVSANPPLGEVFDAVAEDYDTVREGYSIDLVRTASDRGGLRPGARVVEVGCGTGKLTEVLVGLGFSVDAVDPGPNMIEQAKRRVGTRGDVNFHVGRFEETSFPDEAYDAIFSATAFHWIDPGIGWAKAASHLREGALLALLTHSLVFNDRSEQDWSEFAALVRAYAPGVEPWPPPRALDILLDGAHERSENASSVWDWIMGEGRFGLARQEVARLFEAVETTAIVRDVELTADDLVAHFRTTSHYFQIDPAKREAFEHEDRRRIEARGGVVHSSSATVLMTALHSA